MKVNKISIVDSLRAIKFSLIALFSMVLSVEAYAQSAPYLSALDIDGDCYYQISFNAPLNVQSNYKYELYEKIGSGPWPSSPIVVRSIAAGNIAPFYFQRTSNPIGIYTYKSRVCIANTASCSGFSNEIIINNPINCQTLPAPSISMSNPGNLYQGDNVTLTASASTSSGSITSVEFYEGGGTLIGADYSAPYSIAWRPSNIGSNVLRAVANGSNGAVSVTPFTTVVISPRPQPPTVSLTSPVNLANYNLGALVTLSASASDSDGYITKVNFYVNNLLIASDSTAPFLVSSWSPGLGSYSVKAVAYDNSGLSATSTINNITIGKTVVSGEDIDADCYFVLNLNAPGNVLPNLIYEFYEKTPGQLSWSTSPTATRSTGYAVPHAPPFRVKRENQASGRYEYKSRICLTGTSTCGPFSETYVVNVSPTCQSVAVPLVNITTLTNGQELLINQPVAVGATAITAVGAIQKVTFYGRGLTLGVDSSFPYEASWTPTALGDYAIEAVADGTNGGTNSSGWITVKVVKAHPPSVSLVAPTNLSTYKLGDVISVLASAADIDGDLDRVVFYANGTEIGTVSTSPYEFKNWNPSPGTYDIYAKAFDRRGLNTQSASQRITVSGLGKPIVSGIDIDADCYYTLSLNAPNNVPSNYVYEFYEKTSNGAWPETPTTTRSTSTANVPPFRIIRADYTSGSYDYKTRICLAGRTVCDAFSDTYRVTLNANCSNTVVPNVFFTSPANGQVFARNALVNFKVTATTTEGEIASVAINQGGKNLGTTSIKPYDMNWIPREAGDYLFEAVADGTNGGTKSSGWLNVKVVDGNAPSITLTSPASDATYGVGITVPVAVNASDIDNDLQKVIFYADGIELHTDSEAPYELPNWKPAAGVYDVYAVAFDNIGLSTKSTIRKVTASGQGIPVLTGLDIDADCYYSINLNAPNDMPSNYVYEVYEKLSSDNWPATPTLYRSKTLGNVPPFQIKRSSYTSGSYDYKARICLDGVVGSCDAFSAVFTVNLPSNCQSLIVPSVDITSLVSGQELLINQPVVIKASATTTQGTIEKVTFNNGGSTLGVDVSSPYETIWTPSVLGEYLIEAVADGSNGGTSTTGWIAVKVVSSFSSSSEGHASSINNSSRSSSSAGNFDTDEGTVISEPPTTAESSPVGALAGAFRVDESGSANYTMAIAVPAGVAGVAPQLAVGYNSQGGAGLVGVGGNVSGVGGITRCRQTLLQDGVAKPITWTAEDRFCLNGQRLMLVDESDTYGDVGAEYKTEIDSYVKVISVEGVAGNPSYFVAEAKDGSKTTYGGTDDSRLMILSNPLNWMQSRFEDSVGNRIDYEYEGDANTGQRVKQVKYAYPASKTSTAHAASVTFTYKDRTDISASYASGGVYLKSTKLLDSVTSYNGSNIFRKYNFYYNETNYSSVDNLNRLTSAEECISASPSSCYPKTQFSWGYKTTGFDTGSGIWLNRLPSAKKFKTYRFMDFNGDARQDFVWVRGSGTNRYIEYGAINRYASGGLQKKSFSNNSQQLFYIIANDNPASDKAELKIEVIDYNNDGRQDLAVCRPVDQYGVDCGNWDLYLSVSDSKGGWQLSSTAIALPITQKAAMFGDLNSDGLLDVIDPNTGGGLKVFFGEKRDDTTADSNQYYGFSAQPQILNLTGTPEIPQTEFDGATETPVERSRYFDLYRAVVGDINGDGKVDLMIPGITTTPVCSSGNRCHETVEGEGYESDSIYTELFVYSFNGSEFEYVPAYKAHLASEKVSWGAAIFNTVVVKPVDINGDGLIDIVSMNGTNWRYHLNTANEFSFGGNLTNIVSNSDATDSLEVFDYNQDGYPDVLWHDKKNKQLKLRKWDVTTQQMSTTDTVLFSNKPALRNYSVGDVTGDGFADLIELKTDDDENIDIGIFTGNGSATSLDKIYTITDGNHRITQISYGSLANSQHYTTLEGINTVSATDTSFCEYWTYPAPCVDPTVFSLDEDGFYTQLNRPFGEAFENANPAPLMEFIAPNYVVTQVAGSAPLANNSSNLSAITYHYHHARIQAGGRGYLGFEKLSTIDQQTGIKTETTYHQDWPFIGAAKRTIVTTKEGNKLSEATNTWATEIDSDNSRIRRVYLDKSTETSYSLNNEGKDQGSSLQTIATDNDFDEYGNATRVEVITSDAANSISKVVDNAYGSLEWDLRMGRLETSTSTIMRNSESAIVRSTQFEYYGELDSWPGMLKKEIIEPGDNEQIVEYEYDPVGNKIRTFKTANVQPGVSQTREAEWTYDTANRFVETSIDSLGNTISGVVDGQRHPTYGLPSRVRDVNGVLTNIEYNSDGTERLRSSGGAWGHSEKAFCTPQMNCPSAARYRVEARVSGGGRSTEYFDVLGRSVRSSKAMFDGRESQVDTEYDSLGRLYRKSEPYFTGDSIIWTTFAYDIVGRVETVVAPDGSITTYDYADYITTVTVDKDGKALTRQEERNGLGNLVKITDHLGGTIRYTYDPLGNLTSSTTAADGKSVAVKICYDQLGRKIAMHDPDKGGFLGNANESCATLEGQLDDTASQKTAGWWFYKYNDFGELIEQTDTKKQVVSMSYDELGRMISRTDKRPGGSVESHTRWYYDRAIGEEEDNTATQLKLTGVVTSYDQINEECGGANYCQTYSYDEFSRLTDTVTYLPNVTTGYINTIQYDSIGRAFKHYDVLNGLVQTSGTRTQFNEYGYAELVNDLTSGDILQKTEAMNARGQIVEELRNNGAAGTTNYTYDDASGRLTDQTTTLAGALFGIQKISYEWDKLGNLMSRHNQSGNLTPDGSTTKKDLKESFCYDALNRLTKSRTGELTPDCGFTAADPQDLEYDGLGNITFKNGMGIYTYSGKGPHAVTSTSIGNSYTYDNNGNQTSGGGRNNITYSSYDQPLKIASTGITTDFIYGPDRARFERKDNRGGGNVTVTHYLGNVERIQVQNSSVVEWKRYIAGAVYTVKTTLVNGNYQVDQTDKSYLFNDHLGSLDVVTNAMGVITHSASFDAWGKRRNGENWTGEFNSISLDLTAFDQPLTQRGYTGHEMLDEHNLIHMNGRIYDAKLARFLQADPFIQAAGNTQNYNRYSYLMNNPLNATDPSGFFISNLWGKHVMRPLYKSLGYENSQTLISVGSMFCGPWAFACAAGASYDLNRAFGAPSEEAFFLASRSSFASLASLAAGGVGGGLTAGQSAFASAFVGGVTAELQGGKFGHGFVSAGVGNYFGRQGPGAGGFIAAVVVGGTVSEMTGGKFANGAASAAMYYVAQWGASKIRAGGINNLTTEGKKGPDRYSPEQQESIKKEIALATDAENYNKIGKDSHAEVAKYFRSKLQGIAENWDIEIGTEIYSSGGKFFIGNPTTSFKNHTISSWEMNMTSPALVKNGIEVHTHQTTDIHSPGDLHRSEGYRTTSYLSNKDGLFLYEGGEYVKAYEHAKDNGLPLPQRQSFKIQ